MARKGPVHIQLGGRFERPAVTLGVDTAALVAQCRRVRAKEECARLHRRTGHPDGVGRGGNWSRDRPEALPRPGTSTCHACASGRTAKLVELTPASSTRRQRTPGHVPARVPGRGWTKRKFLATLRTGQ